MAKKTYWTIAAQHKGSALSSGVIYWRQDSVWTKSKDDAHHFRSAATAEKNLPDIQNLQPEAYVLKVNPNALW